MSKRKNKETTEDQDTMEEDTRSQTAMFESMANLMKEHTAVLERLQKERDEREERMQKERAEREDRMQRERRELEAKMLQAQKEQQKEQQAQWLKMQKEADETRRQHELDLLHLQQEFEAKRRETEQRNKLADKLVKWEDHDQPQDYLIRFEDTMKQSEIPRDQWPHRLRPLLSGRALMAYSRDVPDTAKTSYQDLKSALLDSLGMPVKQCRERIWSFQKRGSDSHQDTARKLEFLMQRAAHGCDTVQDVVSQLTMAKFLTLYPPDVANYVQLQDPHSVGEAANLVQAYYQRQQSRDYRRPYSSHRPWQRDRYSGGFREDGQRCADDNATRDADKQGGEFGRSKDSYKGGKPDRAGSRHVSFGSQGDHKEWVPTCFSCGKKGHKRPDCPMVRRVVSPDRQISLRVEGRIGEHECQMTIDTGAQKTVVNSALVKPDEYTGESIRLLGFNGGAVTVPLAKVWLHIGDYVFQHVVAVCQDSPEQALLGLDIGILDYLMQLEKEQREKRESSSNKVSVNVTTRAQTKATQEQDREDKNLSLKDQASPTPVTLEPKQTVEEKLVEEELESKTEDQVEVEPDIDEDGEMAVPTKLDKVEDSGEFPLPALDEAQEDKALLREQQQKDESLVAVRAWAEKGEKGYGYQDGLLVHVCEGETGEQLVRIVVPECRRRKVLQVSHSCLTGGHFSNRKTEAALRRAFTWPGISRDLKIWCRSCPECQKAAKPVNYRAPLRPLPVIREPFSRIAFDLVGPLPRTKHGNQYLLTCICLASKYPEAVPLKRVDAKSVAEAMLEVFARTGLPCEILTDQGSVFMGRLMREMCETLGIKQIRTSPYHPQTDGCLERWHGSLKSMLRKCENRQTDWDRLLKYMLFAYRSSPHTNTGFAPFEVIFGRPLRGPLDVLKDGWLSGDMKDVSTIEWVNNLREKLCEITDLVCEREAMAKARMKQQYDKHTKPRQVELGTLVLVRTPDLHGKLSDIWDGPYEVLRRITDLTYELAVPSRRSKRMVAHLNMLKAWHSPEAKVLRVVLAEDNEGESDKPPSRVMLSDSELNKDQEAQLTELLSEFKDVLNESVGKAWGVSHNIDTATQAPIRSVPYRLAPAWRDQLRDEIRALLEADIIKPSLSPWSSPMVPVKKPDGSVRLCIDYRKVNQATVPDPYAIPLIEDLLDQLGEARYLSKLDLNKGFYQIPVEEKDQPKTAFCSPWGKYEFKRMPFGLRNAPASFQRFMHVVLAGQEQAAGSYIDDVIVFSKTWDEHLVHLRQTLESLRKYGLTAKPCKCQWGASSLTYLGHVVGRGKVSVPECRVEAIRNFRKPRTKTDLRAFLGTVGYYRRFIRDYSAHAFALTEATKNAAPNIIVWNDVMNDAFCYLCNVLSDVSILFLPTCSDVFVLQTDASGRGVGGVLSICRNGDELPVGYFSRKLKPAERNYSATELECLAVVQAIDHFAAHLIGRPFTVETDHRALQYLHSSRHLNSRLTRWALKLQSYTFDIRYRPGKSNQNADGLSRQAWPEDEDTGDNQDPAEDVRTFREGGSVRLKT